MYGGMGRAIYVHVAFRLNVVSLFHPIHMYVYNCRVVVAVLGNLMQVDKIQLICKASLLNNQQLNEM